MENRAPHKHLLLTVRIILHLHKILLPFSLTHSPEDLSVDLDPDEESQAVGTTEPPAYTAVLSTPPGDTGDLSFVTFILIQLVSRCYLRD